MLDRIARILAKKSVFFLFFSSVTISEILTLTTISIMAILFGRPITLDYLLIGFFACITCEVVVLTILLCLVKRLRETKEALMVYVDELESKARLLDDQGLNRYDTLLDEGNAYIIESEKTKRAINIFKILVKHGFKGQCITTLNPDILKRRYGLSFLDIQIVWLSEVDSDIALNLDDIDAIKDRISTFLSENEKTVILLLNPSVMIAHQDFKSFLSLLKFAEDQIAVHKSRMLISIDPKSIEDKHLRIIQRDVIALEKKSRAGKLVDIDKTSMLIKRKEDIEYMINLSRIKYYKRRIDKESFREIIKDYQKQLIEIEAELNKG